MRKQEQVENKVQDLKGRAKQKVGKAMGKPDMEAEGKSDRVKASVNGAKTSLKEAGDQVKGAIKRSK